MARVINWPELLRERRVDYVTSGPNVGRDEIAIQCPFCGSADPSHHMGLNLETGYWSCWRNRQQHSGKSPLRLLMKLLRVSYEQAREIAGLDASFVDPEGFDALAARLLRQSEQTQQPTQERRFLEFDLDAMQPLAGNDRLRVRRHRAYLRERGFDPDMVAKRYSLMAGVSGKWADRVIIPTFMEGRLVTWTGRAISGSFMRYRDLELDDALLGQKEILLNYDRMAAGGRLLIIQEGPFDVLKVDMFSHRFGVVSGGLCTNGMSPEQADMIRSFAPRFERCLIAMDTKTPLGVVDSMRMKRELSDIPNLGIAGIPYGAGDGGNLSAHQVNSWIRSLLA